MGLRKVLKKENIEEKWKKRKFERKIKDRFKFNKLILYILFKMILFVSTKEFKMMENFDYILVFFMFFNVKPNMRKIFFDRFRLEPRKVLGKSGRKCFLEENKK